MAKRVYVLNIGVIILLISLLSCSKDNIKLANFYYKGKEYSIRIKDVKEDFLLTARKHRQITNDITYHKNSIFANYLSQEIAVIEELENGLTNSIEFNIKYELFRQKKYYLELFSRGQKVLLREMEINLKNRYKNLTSEEKQIMENEYANNFKKKNITNFYEIDKEKNSVKIGEKFYHPLSIPEDIVLFKIFDKTYNWKISKEIILLFEPNFNNQDLKEFQEKMENLKDLLLAVEVAKNKGLDKGLKIDEKNIIKEIALENFRSRMRDDFQRKILPEITPKVLKAYYESNKHLAVVEKNKKLIQLSYNDLKDEIYNVVCEERWNDFIRSWNEEMKNKYNISYYEKGIKTLMNMEIKYISKIYKERKNLAFNKKSFSSITNNHTYAFDGDKETLCVFLESPIPKWIGVDLGKKSSIESIVLQWGENYPTVFTVQVSDDGIGWRNIYYVDKVFGGMNKVLLERVRARYIRIFTSETSGFSIKEFEVY